MIRVNLIGAGRKKTARSRAKVAVPTSMLPIIHALVLVAAIGGGYMWYAGLSSTVAGLTDQIASAEAQKAALEAVIEQDRIYEARKLELENRISIIEGLQRNQVNPVMSLDILSEALDRTEYVWLSSMDQNNAVLSMSGLGTSVNAIADFVRNLENTGYFRNVNLVNAAQGEGGNFSFSMNCEFAPPVRVTETAGDE